MFAWVADNLGADLRAEVLAERANMSPRTFARACMARIGTTPARAVEMMRVQAARESIEGSDTPLSTIAMRYAQIDSRELSVAMLMPHGVRSRRRRAS